jgi:hypothetical protein
MVLEKIGVFYYDSDDIIGKCTKCGKDMYNVPELSRRITMSIEEQQLFELGSFRIGFCPACYTVQIAPE